MAVRNDVKLRNAFAPTSYDLHLTVDLSAWSYRAVEVVKLQRCPQHPMSDIIHLHAAPSLEVLSVDGATLLKRDAAAHTLELKLADSTAAEPQLRFSFSHHIQEELRGLYRVKFQHDGKEHRMASTHFEPVAARLMYICQDEPAQRADFTLAVSLPASEEHYTVLSNGPLLSKTIEPGAVPMVVHRFAMVPKCPPYLTACVIGELESIGTEVGGTPVRVYTSPGKISRAAFALETAAFALAFFERFFQCPFPLPKLDVVAVPDFPIGGMENWGCITCVESILVDPLQSSVQARKRASELLCHEVSHNWFGNLVAINWWEGLWLKEGFASWCGNYAAHHQNSSWNCLESAARSVAGAMDFDMFDHSHPVEVPICDPADITQIFDLISYDKGMGLVFMLEAFLAEKWGPAVAHYIKKYQYKDTMTVQLWEALEESSGLSIKEAMTSFTTQMGYPVIHVERRSRNRVALRQQPCRYTTSSQTDSPIWCVPLVLEGADATAGRVAVMLRGAEVMEVELPESIAASPFLTVNPKRTGFYRCRYDDATFQAWLENYKALPPADRRAILSDTVAAISMGYDDVSRLGALADVVRREEQDNNVLEEFVENMKHFIGCFDDGELRRSVRAAQLSFLVPLAAAIVGKTSENSTEELRNSFFLNAAMGLILSGAVTVEDASQRAIYEWALAEAARFLSGGVFTATTLANSLAIYIRHGTPADAKTKGEQLYAKLLEVDGNDELCRALTHAMCMSPDVSAALDIATKCSHNSGVRSHYGGIVFAALAANPSCAAHQVWTYFMENFKSIDQQWGGGQFRIQLIVSLVGSTLRGEEAAEEFQAFFSTHPLPNARLAIGRSAEGIRARAMLNKKWNGPLASLLCS